MPKKFETKCNNRTRSKEAKRLIKLRKRLGWSQARLAEEWKVSPGTIALWETDTRAIPGPVEKLIEIYEQGHFVEPQMKNHGSTYPKAKINKIDEF